MADIITLPLSDRWLFSVDVVQPPGGVGLVARLTDMRASEIQVEDQPRFAMMRLVKMLREAADGMEAEADTIGLVLPEEPR